MVPNRKLGKQVLQTYCRHTPKNISLFAFMPSSIKRMKKGVWGLQYRKKRFRQKKFPFPGVVYNRCYHSQPIPYLEKAMSRTPIFNQLNQFNKQAIDGYLRNSNLSAYLPETTPYDLAETSRMLAQYRMVILKPILGFRGHGVYRIEKTEKGEIQISHHHYAPFVILPDESNFELEIGKLIDPQKYMVQQGISFLQLNDKQFDIRVLVQKNRAGQWEVGNMVSRIAHSGCFNTSMCEKVSFTEELLRRHFPEERAYVLLHSLRDLSLQAAACIEQQWRIHLGEISVDFGLDSDVKLWVIEINGKPQKSICNELQLSGNIYKNPIDYALYLLTQSPS
jgi:glutathione synthase/RimK-type ligase-like ATP-grasp enzyme